MPHLRIDYTANLDPEIRMGDLCRALAGAMAGLADASGKSVFPLAGTRVLAYPAPCHAVADGHPDNAFIYLNLRVTPGRSDETIDLAGATLLAAVRAHIEGAGLLAPLAVTVHIDQLAASYEGRYRPG
ncbi:5-carboxymethyl-2-hydroxymuconate isomerase [Massilia glaciei]|uniref:5-carboxymethyl-2-hydroxymuconate isomerase n=1 Tax=Massilia glaciei TaxID=1524097 RepID=A0A2U2I676_9BURK|nr:5-carboxymethyl-2-hydroxymuconate isomerase [Massilia glaciei]PWF55267.1 5-carboxymethyl-2-hydroxymuconate isomerase [Massilia glaciei]